MHYGVFGAIAILIVYVVSFINIKSVKSHYVKKHVLFKSIVCYGSAIKIIHENPNINVLLCVLTLLKRRTQK